MGQENSEVRGEGVSAPEPSAAPVGRSAEFAQMADALESCLRGEGRVVTITGAVASGKTELLHAFSAYAAARGAVYLGAASSALERDFPYGVARQLIQAAPLDPASAARLGQRLDEQAFPSGTGDAPVDGPIAAQVRHELCSQVLRLAERTPVVLGVDDMQYVDGRSFEFLLHLIRRIGSARVLVVLSEREFMAPVDPLFEAELDRQPASARIRLDMLSRSAVAEVLRRRLGARAADRLAAEVHAVSGGNPLLVSALVEDCGTAEPAAEDRGPASGGRPRERRAAERVLVVGASFRRGVMGCLYRMEPAALLVARALAVLGEAASADRLGELLDLDPGEAAQAVRSLGGAGMLRDGQLRHRAVGAAVLGGMTGEDRARLHRRAASLLHTDGAAPIDIAHHVLAAGGVQAPWALPTLQHAADQALACGRVQDALDCLKLARRSSTGEIQQAEATAALTGVEWLLNPASASRHVPWLARAVDDGQLRGRHALLAVRYFTWYGLADEAIRALELLDDPASDLDVQTAAQMWTAYTLLTSWYPGLRGRSTSLSARSREIPAITSRLDGLDLLVAVLSGRTDDQTVAHAEQVLRQRRLADRTLESLVCALTALMYADRPDLVEQWSGILLDQASSHHAPITYALLSAVRAESALRQGDLVTAEACARLALERVSPEGWGVLVGIPLATAVAANTAMGRYEEAARHLEFAAPNATFRTLAVLHYLHARGRYNLAVGRPDAALAAFRACGDLMRQWDMDLQGVVPWRVEAARALLRLEMPDEARLLLDEETSRLAPGPSRTRAMALRVRAATIEPRRRPAMLWEAVRMAQSVGDQLEAAGAVTDLSAAYRSLGEIARARMAARWAMQLATECGAEPLREALAADLTTTDLTTTDPTETSPANTSLTSTSPAKSKAPVPKAPVCGEEAVIELSDAERRVAALAAQGNTNREIARRLYITVSTVEQHLTRVYRKLGVTRRLDLPTRLEPDVVR